MEPCSHPGSERRGAGHSAQGALGAGRPRRRVLSAQDATALLCPLCHGSNCLPSALFLLTSHQIHKNTEVSLLKTSRNQLRRV